MVDYREILRLSELYSQRQIAASIGSSHHTVKEVLETANAKGIKWPLEDNVSNEDLQGILFPGKYASTSGYMELDYEHIHAELAKPGVTLTLLWDEYNEKCISAWKRPYMTTQFGDITVAGQELRRRRCVFITSPATLWKSIGRDRRCWFTMQLSERLRKHIFSSQYCRAVATHTLNCAEI